MSIECGKHDLRSPRLIAQAASLGDGRMLIQGLDFGITDRVVVAAGNWRQRMSYSRGRRR
jgi:hypothetical protein